MSALLGILKKSLAVTISINLDLAQNIQMCTAVIEAVTPLSRTFRMNNAPGGGGYLVFLSDGDMPFSEYRFRLFFPVRGIKRRQILWGPLSNHVKRGKFVRSSCYLVRFLCFRAYFHRFFCKLAYHLKTKFWSRVKKIYAGTSKYKFRSSIPTPGGK